MNVIYFHLMSFLTNFQADKRIRKVLKDCSTGGLVFRYQKDTRTIETRYRLNFKGLSTWVEEQQEKAITQVHQIECERRKTLDQLERELHCREDVL